METAALDHSRPLLLNFHLRKPSACEVSQSTVMRRTRLQTEVGAGEARPCSISDGRALPASQGMGKQHNRAAEEASPALTEHGQQRRAETWRSLITPQS